MEGYEQSVVMYRTALRAQTSVSVVKTSDERWVIESSPAPQAEPWIAVGDGAVCAWLCGSRDLSSGSQHKSPYLWITTGLYAMTVGCDTAGWPREHAASQERCVADHHP